MGGVTRARGFLCTPPWVGAKNRFSILFELRASSFPQCGLSYTSTFCFGFQRSRFRLSESATVTTCHRKLRLVLQQKMCVVCSRSGRAWWVPGYHRARARVRGLPGTALVERTKICCARDSPPPPCTHNGSGLIALGDFVDINVNEDHEGWQDSVLT